MNPSRAGWIDKYIYIVKDDFCQITDQSSLNIYKELKRTGFIFGHSTAPVYKRLTSEYKLIPEEMARINLLHMLFYFYFSHRPETEFNQCIATLLDFYNRLLPSPKQNFFLFKLKDSRLLEKIISRRISQSKHPLGKLASASLLFADGLALNRYLKNGENPSVYIETFEHLIFKKSFAMLKSKAVPTKSDLLVTEMLKQSETYFDESPLKNGSLSHFFSEEIEKRYLIDMVTLSALSDLKWESGEIDFLKNWGREIGLANTSVEESLESTHRFLTTNGASLQLFQLKNPVKEFYEQSNKTVEQLILRNKKRLAKELKNNTELLLLLSKSTYTTLSKQEKKQVKRQLIETVKTIPSLAIFLLPGGSILLPILVKFIPQLLPSTFKDNQIPEKE